MHYVRGPVSRNRTLFLKEDTKIESCLSVSVGNRTLKVLFPTETDENRTLKI
jgi:hypothetical protein